MLLLDHWSLFLITVIFTTFEIWIWPWMSLWRWLVLHVLRYTVQILMQRFSHLVVAYPRIASGITSGWWSSTGPWSAWLIRWRLCRPSLRRDWLVLILLLRFRLIGLSRWRTSHVSCGNCSALMMLRRIVDLSWSLIMQHLSIYVWAIISLNWSSNCRIVSYILWLRLKSFWLGHCSFNFFKFLSLFIQILECLVNVFNLLMS